MNAWVMADCDGRTLDALALAIDRRRKACHETAVQACAATAINILQGIRSRTAIVREKKAENDFRIEDAPQYTPGFSMIGGHPTPVIKHRGGHHIAGTRKLVWTNAPKLLEKTGRVFIVLMKYHRMIVGRVSYDRAYVVAAKKDDARRWARKQIHYFVQRYRGMGKWIVGQAQRAVAAKCNTVSKLVEDVARPAKRYAIGRMAVVASGTGLTAARTGVAVRLGLDYQIDALNGGRNALNLIFQKSANRTVAIIKAHGGQNIWNDLHTPFPEIVGK